jgi:GTPase SAR1 family protein
MIKMSLTPETESQKRYFKVAFIGKQGVGKTSIIRRLVASNVDTEYKSTLGIYYYNLELEFQKQNFHIQFWDISASLENQITNFLRNTNIVVMVFDFNKTNSYQYLMQVFGTIREFNPEISFVFAGTSRKENDEKIPKDLSNFSKEHSLPLYQISMNDNAGMSLLLQAIIQMLSTKNENK